MARAKRSPVEVGAFGPPDGARAALDEIHFIDFSNRPADEDLASPPSDRSARIVVGKKGVGKTVYLRRFHENATHETSIYAADIEHDVPATEDVIRLCGLYPSELATEAWKWVWRRAILRALVSHLLCKPSLRERITPANLESLEEDYAAILITPKRVHGVYAEARAIAARAQRRDQLASELRHADWDDLEELLGEILEELPPICFYLDSVDEQFSSAPFFWLSCQKGLCHQVLDLYRDHRFGGRLHVVVAVRDLVRSSLLQGEHATRYRRARHIRVLDWDHEAIRYFLHEKIRRLPPRFRMSPRGQGVSAWLGSETIYNPARGVEERTEDYLLRHTRLVPRDVVQLGNELCSEIERAKASDSGELSMDAIRRAVSVVAKEFADEQVYVTANHLASDNTPRRTGRHDVSDFFTSEWYSTGVEGELCHLIESVGVDRFPLSELRKALENAAGSSLADHPNPLDVLWLNGLLGYDAAEEGAVHSHFYGVGNVADFGLPLNADSYVFHPIIGHKVRILAAGDRPVRPFR